MCFYHDGKTAKKHWLNYGASLTNIGGKVCYGNYRKRTIQPTLLKLGVSQNFILGKTQNILMFAVDAIKLLVPTPSVRNSNNEVIAGRNEEIITGIGTVFQSWTTAPDGLRETIREITFSFGTEFQFRKFLYARVGHHTQNKIKGDIHYLTLGLGGKFKNFGLDFAYLMPDKQHTLFLNIFRISSTVHNRN